MEAAEGAALEAVGEEASAADAGAAQEDQAVET